MDKSINLEKIKALDSTEAVAISNLFGMAKHNIETLLDYGFVFDYDNRRLESKIIINDVSYTVYIDYAIDKDIKYYYIYLNHYKESASTLKGYGQLRLYCDNRVDINSFNIETFLYWIKNLYELNSKDSFKEFVSKEKENVEKPKPPVRPVLKR